MTSDGTDSLLIPPPVRGVASITFNRPEKGNAFDRAMADGLLVHLRRLDADDTVRIIVLRGAGKHFSSGADVGAAVSHGTFVEIFRVLDASPKATIAAVGGGCVGAAAALVACCDCAIAAETAFFSIPQVRIGVAPVGVTPPLVRAIGLASYRRIALSGERIGAQEAHRLGLVARVCPAAALDDAVGEAAEGYLLGAPAAIRDLKAYLARSYPEMRRQLEAAAAHHAETDAFAQPDALEGASALRERRKPSWYPG